MILDTDTLLVLAERAQRHGGEDWSWNDPNGRPEGLRRIEDPDVPGGYWYSVGQGAHLGDTLICIDDAQEGTGDHAAFVQAASPKVVTELIRRLRAADSELDLRRRMNVDAINRLCSVLPGATGCESQGELLERLIAMRQPVYLDGEQVDLDALAKDMAQRIASTLRELAPPERETCERCLKRPAMVGEHRCGECL